MSSTRQRIAELGLELPEPPAPGGMYRPVAVHGSIAQVSGQLSREGNRVITGPVTATTAPALITRAGRACVLRALSALAHALCDLARVEEILFVRGFVHAGPDFQDHSTVLDSASAMLLDIFGAAGDLAVLLADGGRSISDFAVLLDQPNCSALASTATAWRVLDKIDTAMLKAYRAPEDPSPAPARVRPHRQHTATPAVSPRHTYRARREWAGRREPPTGHPTH